MWTGVQGAFALVLPTPSFLAPNVPRGFSGVAAVHGHLWRGGAQVGARKHRVSGGLRRRAGTARPWPEAFLDEATQARAERGVDQLLGHGFSPLEANGMLADLQAEEGWLDEMAANSRVGGTWIGKASCRFGTNSMDVSDNWCPVGEQAVLTGPEPRSRSAPNAKAPRPEGRGARFAPRSPTGSFGLPGKRRPAIPTGTEPRRRRPRHHPPRSFVTRVARSKMALSLSLVSPLRIQISHSASFSESISCSLAQGDRAKGPGAAERRVSPRLSPTALSPFIRRLNAVARRSRRRRLSRSRMLEVLNAFVCAQKERSCRRRGSRRRSRRARWRSSPRQPPRR